MDRAVARALEPDRQALARVERAVAALGRPVAEHAVVVGVLPGEEGRARRAAERERHEAAGERGALAAEQRAHAGHHPHRLERLVVGHQTTTFGRFAAAASASPAPARPGTRAAAPRRPEARRARMSAAGAHPAVQRQPAAVARSPRALAGEAPCRRSFVRGTLREHGARASSGSVSAAADHAPPVAPTSTSTRRHAAALGPAHAHLQVGGHAAAQRPPARAQEQLEARVLAAAASGAALQRGAGAGAGRAGRRGSARRRPGSSAGRGPPRRS